VPMILGADGARLSKRHGAVSVMQYRDEGYLPEALLNYLVRLGWSHGDQEVFSVDEMIEYFEIADVNHSASSFNPDKLLWLNHHYLMNSDPVHVAHHLRWHLGQLDIDPTVGPDPVEVVKAQRERCKTLVDMARQSAFLYQDFLDYDPKAVQKHLQDGALPLLEILREKLAAISSWDKETIHGQVVRTAEEGSVKLGNVAQPLRVALTGTTVSPPIDVTVELLGRERTSARIERACRYIVAQSG
jgi:glutamyl-tRNA synthetase